jgi:phosphoribosylglycinamide formyltransferase 1
MSRLRVAVFISGRGSNLRALMNACREPGYPAEIGLVVSNRSEALGFARAERSNVPSKLITARDRGSFAADAQRYLEEYGIELIALAGFMKILDTEFVERWRDRILNIHPSLLPSFPGLNAQRQALQAGVRFSGCTVHFVRPKVDSGPIIGQGIAAIYPDDDERSLSDRILQQEHRLYPYAIRLFAEGRLRVVNETVEVVDWNVPQVQAINPDNSIPSLNPDIQPRKVAG